MLSFLLRRCGVYGLYFHNDEQRFVLSISVERSRDESDENNQNEPKQAEQSSGWSTGWFSSFFSGSVDPFTRGGICTQSLLAVLKANSAQKGWRSLDFDSLLRQIGNLLNRQRESAGVIMKGSSRLDTRTLGTVWTETAEVRRALLVGLCYPATNATNATNAKLPELQGSWNDVTDMQAWLQSENLFSASEIRTLTDQPSGNEPGGRVSREQILQNLRWLLLGDGSVRSGGEARLLLHFSGHGDGMKLCPSEESDLPISDFELSEMINEFLPTNATLTCIFDCCDGTKMLDGLLKHPIAFGTTKNLY
eukprot:s4866_g5.t1